MLILLAVVAVAVVGVIVWCVLAISADLDPEPVSQDWIHTHTREDR